jgi:colicin import membrane protein
MQDDPTQASEKNRYPLHKIAWISVACLHILLLILILCAGNRPNTLTTQAKPHQTLWLESVHPKTHTTAAPHQPTPQHTMAHKPMPKPPTHTKKAEHSKHPTQAKAQHAASKTKPNNTAKTQHVNAKPQKKHNPTQTKRNTQTKHAKKIKTHATAKPTQTPKPTQHINANTTSARIAKAKQSAIARAKTRAKAKQAAIAKAKTKAKQAAIARAKAKAKQAAIAKAKAKAKQAAIAKARARAKQAAIAKAKTRARAKQAAIARAQRQAQEKALLAQYQRHVLAAIQAHWHMPPGTPPNARCVFLLKLNKTGQLKSLTLLQSSHNRALDLSAAMAIRRASPLPIPQKAPFAQVFQSIKLTVSPQGV